MLSFRLIPWTSAEETRFKDVFILIMAAVLAGIVMAYVQIRTLRSDISDDDMHQRKLTEEVGALRQRVADFADARTRSEAALRVPHPTLEDREANVIGDHTNVSWNYSGHDSKHVSYEVELKPLKLSQPCNQETDFLGCSGTRFIATDAANETTRIPPTDDDRLSPGTYAWRVAAVPVGAVGDLQLDDPKRLSDWSAYATFNIQPTIMAGRILGSGHIRVGMNLEQNSRFARRALDGSIKGFDISIVYDLLEGCLQRETEPKRQLIFDEMECQDYLANGHREPFTRAGSCEEDAANSNHLCYDLIPVAKWGDWVGALRRKEIDMFIGGVTASEGRQGRGITFTKGYLNFQSRIYTRSTDVKGKQLSSIDAWLTRDRWVGAIADSSNERLLDEIIAGRLKDKKHGHIIKPTQQYRTFPALESAMDRGEIDGILIDETFFGDHDQWMPLADLRQSEPQAWKEYVRKFVGLSFLSPDGKEQFAIAVADDYQDPQVESLAHILSRELRSAAFRRFLGFHCKSFWPGVAASGYQCQVP
jgi:ABC-type amino acid transport substrate-binding protein